MSISSNHTPEQIVSLLRNIILIAPAFRYEAPMTSIEERWIGRAEALVEASGATVALIEFRIARGRIGSMSFHRTQLMTPLTVALARAELAAPSIADSAFIPPGDSWNGYTAILKIIQQPCETIMIVDPYLNSDIFTYFTPHSGAITTMMCMTVRRSQYHDALVASFSKWKMDAVSKKHPIEVRYAERTLLHDRLIILDNSAVWLISQSIKDIAKHSPASVTRADPELSQLKSEYYVNIWRSSRIVE